MLDIFLLIKGGTYLIKKLKKKSSNIEIHRLKYRRLLKKKRKPSFNRLIWQSALEKFNFFFRRRDWMATKRAVFYAKKRIWFWSKRPFMNRKPYWKWKSYKFVKMTRRFFAGLKPQKSRKMKRFLQNGLITAKKNFSFVQKNFEVKSLRLSKKRTQIWKKTFLFFLRKRHRLKYFFKTKLYLNLYLTRLFEFPSRKHLYQFKKFLKNKRQKFSVYYQYFLIRLDYVIWRLYNAPQVGFDEFTPKTQQLMSLRLSQLMISTGHVFVNFHKKLSYLYKLKFLDCLTLTIGGVRTFAYFWRNFRTDFLKFGKTKYRPGFPLRNRLKRFKLKWRRRFYLRNSRKTRTFAKTQLLFYSMLHRWNYYFFKFYHYFYEFSRTIKAYIYIMPVKYSQTAKNPILRLRRWKQSQRYLNYFINMSFK